jgi:hypothetical protein
MMALAPRTVQNMPNCLSLEPPDTNFTERRDHKTYRVQLWDTEGLPFTSDHPQPMRVVRSEEVLERNRYREGELTSHSTDHEWFWFTTLSKQTFPTPVVGVVGLLAAIP